MAETETKVSSENLQEFETEVADEVSSGKGVNGKGLTIVVANRNTIRRTLLTQEELDKELEANMEQLVEPEYTKVDTASNAIQSQDLIAILEGNEGDTADTHEIEMEVLKTKKQRADEDINLDRGDLISSLVNDWSDDNEDQFELKTTASSANSQTVTLVPKTKVANSTSGASKRKSSQSNLIDTDPESGKATVEIINTELENPPSKSPIKIERKRIIKKKVIWDPDDADAIPSNIGSTTIKKVQKLPPTTLEKVQKKPGEVPGRKRRRVTEIDRLLQDEGAINMIYELERENENSDFPEINQSLEEEEGNTLLDIDEARSNLAKKAKLLKNAVIKQTTSPPSRPIRVKREQAQTPTPASTPPPTKVVSPNPAASPATQKAKPVAAPATKKQIKKYENENSMIVRRRSTSSFSDPGSPRRLSDVADPDLDGSKNDSLAKSSPAKSTPPSVPENALKSKTSVPSKPSSSPKVTKIKAEFAKPQARKRTARQMDTSILVAQIRGKLGPAPVKRQIPGPKPQLVTPIVHETVASQASHSKKVIDTKQLSIRKYDKFCYIVLPLVDGKMKDCMTLQLANKIVAALKQTEADPSCQAVVITSASSNFCLGINYHLLLQSDEEKRKSCARDFAAAIRKFLYTLATYSKPLICGLRGEVRGIGLTILPFFDIVIASEDVRLSAPYGTMGHFPEGLSVLRLLGKIKQQTISECFFLNRKLTADEGVKHELITSVVAPIEFNEELLHIARVVSSNTPQAMFTIKASMTYDLREQIDEALKDEETLLIQHWTSNECQERLQIYTSKTN